MIPGNPQSEWEVTIGLKWIDTVYYHREATKEEVYDGLVNHDGYDPRITVRCVKRDPKPKEVSNSLKLMFSLK